MQKENETQEQNCVGLTVQREARCTNDLLGFSDEQLLKLAANGAGLNIKAIQVDLNDCFSALIVGEKHTKEKLIWNPLLDDGDALRLAVKLGFFSNTEGLMQFQAYYSDEIRKDCKPTAATRRAITMGAACIGRART